MNHAGAGVATHLFIAEGFLRLGSAHGSASTMAGAAEGALHGLLGAY